MIAMAMITIMVKVMVKITTMATKRRT